MLDRRLHSVTSFISYAQSDDADWGDGLRTSRDWASEMPEAILFPSNKPSSRADAAILDQWVTKAFESYAQRIDDSKGEENLTKVVEELVPVLSIGLHELVRQVTQHCLERGVVLEKIWRTYVELFERALNETRASLKRHRERTGRVEAELRRTRDEFEQLRQRHPEQIDKLSKTLAGKFAQRQEELEMQLKTLRIENSVLQQHLKEQGASVQLWFPLFRKYKESRYRKQLMNAPHPAQSSTQPEARIAADFKRILGVLPSEGRRRVGFYISALLGLCGAQFSSDNVHALREKKEHNQWKIDRLETRLRDLKENIG